MPNGNQLYGGTLADFDTVDNMAKEIERAFADLRGPAHPLPTGDNARDMRMMFVAIATGVINHLKKNPAAFAVQVDLNSGGGDVTSVSVL